MSSLLFNPITGQPVILAPERGTRPNALRTSWVPSHSAAACPFCLGNEDQTPPEIVRDGIGPEWDVRVVPNKYPFVSPDGEMAGHHEVIVESGRHDARFEDLSPRQLGVVVEIYQSRFMALRASAEYVLLFKNSGPLSGQSIDHLHSQIVTLPFWPLAARTDSESFAEHAQQSRSCPLCDLVHGSRVDLEVLTTPGFHLISAPAARMPFEMWLIPDAHRECFSDSSPGEIGIVLGAAVRALVRRWPDVSYNWEFRQFFGRGRATHWYVAIEPRLTTVAGFELATGMWINIVPPAQAARELRSALGERA